MAANLSKKTMRMMIFHKLVQHTSKAKLSIRKVQTLPISEMNMETK